MIAAGEIEAVAERLETAEPPEVLRWGLETFGSRLAIATTFQMDGMVILDMAVRISPDVRVFTVDTGRLPQQTYDAVAEVHRRYGVRVELVFPEAREVEGMVGRHGPNLFRDSVANRMLCCEIRKTRPLVRKLASLDAWVTGLRRAHGETREQVRKVEIDQRHGGILKLSPLAEWSGEQVRAYAREHGVPQHPLYDEGYTSIGCAPCTRATGPGEDPRAGRWWWEAGAAKECGIHFTPDGKARREVDILLEEIN